MQSPEDKYKYIERIERQLQQKETEERLQKLEAEINSQNTNIYQTVKYKPEVSEKFLTKKVVLGLKLFAIAVATIAAIRIASFLAGVIIVGTIVFVTYKLFSDSTKNKN